MPSDAQRNCTIADREGAVALFERVALLGTSDQVLAVQNWSLSVYRTRYGRLVHAQRIAGMFPYGRRKKMADRCALRHETNAGP